MEGFTHPLEDQNILAVVICEFTTAAPAACVCRLWHSVAKEVRDATLPFADALKEDTITQGKLSEALLLSERVVKDKPHMRYGRYGGGEYHVFNTRQTIRELIRENGGLYGMASRIVAKQRRILKKRVAQNEY